MQQDDLITVFDQQAATYDASWERMTAVRGALDLLLSVAFTTFPPDARILCIGAGTGMEMTHLAALHPGWRFTAVEPSAAMLQVCRQRAEREGFAERCTFHEGFLSSLPLAEPFHGATCLLVSQFVLDPAERVGLFADIADRLHPSGRLFSADLAAPPDAFDTLLRTWYGLSTDTVATDESMKRARAMYAKAVAILPPATVADLIAAGGFREPVQVFQAGLLHAWTADRSAR